MRNTLFALLLGLSACGGSGIGDDDGGSSDAAETDSATSSDGPVVCAQHHDCDEGDPCTSDYCDVPSGTCSHEAIPHCLAEMTLVDEDFEPRAGSPTGDGTLRDFRQGGRYFRARSQPGCPVGVEGPFVEDFDDYASMADGTGGWAIKTAFNGWVGVPAAPGGGAGKSLRVLGSEDAGSFGEAGHSFTAQADGYIAFRIYAPGTAKAKSIFLDEDGTTRLTLTLDETGHVRYDTGAASGDLTTYQANQWYDARIDWHRAGSTASVTFNGVTVNSLAVAPPIDAYLNRVRFRTATGVGVSFYVDDVAASGGEHALAGGHSLRVGWPGASCQAVAWRSFPLKETGTIELDVLATSAAAGHELALGEEWWGDHGDEVTDPRRIVLRLDPDGQVRYLDGDAAREFPSPTSWTVDAWLHLRIRWHAAAGTFDAWLGDADTPVGEGLPVYRAMISGIDHLAARTQAPYADGTLWLDNLTVRAFDVPLVVQATDVHVDEGALTAGWHDPSIMASAVREWNSAILPDVLLMSGDATQASTPAQYAGFTAIFRPANTPARCVPGNHDDCPGSPPEHCNHSLNPPDPLSNYVNALGPPRYGFELGNLHFVAINTHGKGTDGTLTESELADIGNEIADARQTGCGGAGCSTIVAFQHAMPFEGRISEPAATQLREHLSSNGVLVDLAGHSHQCELINRVGNTYYVVSHPLAEPSYLMGYRVLAFDAGAWAQSLRYFSDPLPVVVITWPPNKRETCEDCGNQGCLTQDPLPAAEVDLAATTSGSTVNGRVPLRAKVLPARVRRYEAEDGSPFVVSGPFAPYSSANLSRGAALLGGDSCDTTKEVEFSFEGTRPLLLYNAGPDYGIVEVEVDGAAYPSIDMYAVQDTAQMARALTPPLARGTHTLRLRQLGAKNAASTGCAVVIDAIDVGLGAPLPAEVQVDDGPWQPLDYDRNGLYRGFIETASLEPGAHRVQVRVPAGATGWAIDSISLDVVN